jgi:hypothetical protein
MDAMSVIHFPMQAIVIRKAPEGGWLVLGERGRGWLYGDLRSALAEARWLSRNFGVPIREMNR